MALLYVFSGPKFLFVLLRQTTVLRNIFLNFKYLPVLIRRCSGSRVIHQLQSLGMPVWQRLGERDALGFHIQGLLFCILLPQRSDDDKIRRNSLPPLP